jgi:splicing factor 3A subunit 1
MATLNLPKPVHSYAGEDELRSKTNGTANGNGNGVTVEDVEEDIGEYRPPRPSDKYKTGIIYPPREIRSESA